MGTTALLSFPLAFVSYPPVRDAIAAYPILGYVFGAFLLAVCGLALLRKATRRSRYPFIGRLLRPTFPPRTFLGSVPIVTLIVTAWCAFPLVVMATIPLDASTLGYEPLLYGAFALLLSGPLVLATLVRLMW